MSGIMHKVKDAVTGHHDKDTTQQPNYSSSSSSSPDSKTADNGPHDSKLMNKLDPRVNSEREARQSQSATAGGYGTGAGAYDTRSTGTGPTGTSSTTGGYGSHSGTGTGYGADTTTSGGLGSGTTSGDYNSRSTNAGPHDYNTLNKADPRVDSDRDNRARHEGLGGYGSSTTGTTGGYGSGTTGTTGDNYGSRSTNAGPHDYNTLNKADPRVDSDRDNRARLDNYGSSTTGTGTTGYGSSTGTTGGYGSSTTGTTTGPGSYGHSGSTTTSDYNSRSTNAGPHDSNLLNKADPRVDSDRDNRARHEAMATSSYNAPGGHGLTGTAGYGGGSATAGPHNSNLLNKADPRVDSDLDNRGTVGSQRF